jgi:hypothetical protein
VKPHHIRIKLTESLKLNTQGKSLAELIEFYMKNPAKDNNEVGECKGKKWLRVNRETGYILYLETQKKGEVILVSCSLGAGEDLAKESEEFLEEFLNSLEWNA